MMTVASTVTRGMLCCEQAAGEQAADESAMTVVGERWRAVSSHWRVLYARSKSTKPECQHQKADLRTSSNSPTLPCPGQWSVWSTLPPWLIDGSSTDEQAGRQNKHPTQSSISGGRQILHSRLSVQIVFIDHARTQPITQQLWMYASISVATPYRSTHIDQDNSTQHNSHTAPAIQQH